MSKKEYNFTSGFSHAVAYQLQRWDHLRTDEKFYRGMRLDTLKQIKTWTENQIERSEEQEELIEHECAVTGEEYK